MLQYLTEYLSSKNIEALHQVYKERHEKMLQVPNLSKQLQEISLFKTPNISFKEYSKDMVTIGLDRDIDETQKVELKKILQSFMPWRKGPFSICGIDIDAEWQSNLKWNRVYSVLDSLTDKVVCDLGCGNGYYMYRMLPYKPKFVLGMDPTYKYKMSFDFLNSMAKEDMLKLELFGYNELEFFPDTFDTILCMGVLYHHKDPIQILELCKKALKKGGQLIIESIGIPGDSPTFLMPENRYARMKNIWFIPTSTSLDILLRRLGFRNVQCHFNEIMSTQEQRRTEWANVDSFENFLDPTDSSKTEEGYPSPTRMLFSMIK